MAPTATSETDEGYYPGNTGEEAAVENTAVNQAVALVLFVVLIIIPLFVSVETFRSGEGLLMSLGVGFMAFLLFGWIVSGLAGA